MVVGKPGTPEAGGKNVTASILPQVLKNQRILLSSTLADVCTRTVLGCRESRSSNLGSIKGSGGGGGVGVGGNAITSGKRGAGDGVLKEFGFNGNKAGLGPSKRARMSSARGEIGPPFAPPVLARCLSSSKSALLYRSSTSITPITGSRSKRAVSIS